MRITTRGGRMEQ